MTRSTGYTEDMSGKPLTTIMRYLEPCRDVALLRLFRVSIGD
jgi:hypothetical protein